MDKFFGCRQVASTLVGSWDKSVGGGINLASKMPLAASSIELCHAFTSFNLTYSGTGLWSVLLVIVNLHTSFTALVLPLMMMMMTGELMQCVTLTQLKTSSTTCRENG